MQREITFIVCIFSNDRWGFSPLDEAVRFKHKACQDAIRHHLKLQGVAVSSQKSFTI